MTPTIIPIYAAALAIFGIGLGIHVSALRGKTGISILHGDNMELATRMRRHGNFIEHVPFVILMLAFAEMRGAPHAMLHVQGAALLAARLLHARGLNGEIAASPVRIAGSATTSVVMLSAVAFIIWAAVFG